MTDYKRPYIVLNGVSSDSIDGLMITSIPPISKPAMRYTTEEIDGVDGDIITELGFKAYDKTVGIGLCGEFDIDRVIEYFTGSGKVTFSSEPDKYYLYDSLGEIDFDRLVRYRKASAKLHVQPYKYSTMEKAKVWTVPDKDQSIKIRNAGNTRACPIITIEGSGSVGIYLNGTRVIAISMPSSGEVTIDVETMNAYSGSSLANRLVTGDYSALELPAGTSVISWTGTVGGFSIDKYSRWI